MHYSVLNRATVRVANTRDLSGNVTASSINDGSRAERRSCLWRIYGSTIFASLGLIVVSTALAPISARAQAASADFGPNVKIFNPSMPQSEIQATVDAIASQQISNQFGTQRYAIHARHIWKRHQPP